MATGQGKVVILTGASRGIGLATAHTILKASSSNKLLVVSRTQAALDQLSSQYPDQVEVVAGDITDFSLGRKAVDLAINRWGRIDGVIVNHGTLDPVKKIADITAEEWRAAFDINVFGGLAVVQPAIPHLRSSHGTIILVSSGASVSHYHAWGPYGSSKAVLNHMAGTLSVEEPDITTVSIQPGVVDTEMQKDIREVHNQHMTPKDMEKFNGLKEGGMLLKPEQPGGVLGRLVLGNAKGLSGKYLRWDGQELKDFQA